MSEDFIFLSPQESDQPYSISEINEGIAILLESGNSLVWVEGEISNWKPSSSGHIYFRLKDQQSQIPAVIWRSNVSQLKFEPCEGIAVSAIASIRVYQRGGYYQLDVHRMQPLGSGALYAAFERLKASLEREGLFDPLHKKPLPQSIRRLGVVTSKRGAALRDIIRVVASRAPQTDIVLVDVQVQGDKAAGEIAAAIKFLNEYGNVDCIIAGRGGGSIEDLWAFNEEIVARAIFDSGIPVISAVGHEIDFTIADFVADVRAATPSAAAEIAVSDSRENQRYFQNCTERFTVAARRYFSDVNERFVSAAENRALRRPLRMFSDAVQTKDDLEGRYFREMEVTLQKKYARMSAVCARLGAINPLSVLARGYSIVSTRDGASVRSSEQVVPGTKVKLKFFKGSAGAIIDSIDNGPETTIAF